AAGGAGAAAGAGAAGAGGEVQVSGDLKHLLEKRGPPMRIAQRPDGLTAVRYSEQRPCGVDQCNVTVDYLFDSSGKFVRDEVSKPSSSAAPPEKTATPPEKAAAPPEKAAAPPESGGD
ncbi:MAG TPA: hypothetical protein VG496_03775, partial [Myxococcales bacterium]|nr:hypothetical protein [Myxococcales bacterium]